ncbi:MAG: acyl-CoA synthetase (AMP-forming)/AMP-acid ligase II [Halieaceae bacterium]|jgi:acyl-CoA synthetase (AMP-forming)/AMP-acid ligase II
MMLRATARDPLSVARGVLSAAQRFPDRQAIEAGTRSLSYRELAARILQIGSVGIHDFGLKPGDVVALVSPNRLEYIEIVAGLAEAGLVVATLNPHLSPAELKAILEDCRPALSIVDPTLEDLCNCISEAGIPSVLIGADYEDLLSRARDEPTPDADEYAAFSICYTSGTTGRPKGVLLPHRSRALVCLASAVEYNCFGPGDRFLALAPLFHGAGFAFALAAVSHGGTCILHDGSDGESIICRLEVGDIHGVFMVPTHFKRIHDLPEERFNGFAERHALRTIISNAAALSPRFKVLSVQRFGQGLLHETYGSTEGGVVSNMRPDRLLDLPESVGTPFPWMEVEIRRPDGSQCRPGEVGELFSRGPYTFIGYLNREEATLEALQEGWLTVQDLAVRDEEGFISIVGRIKDMVVSGGVNIYPAEIEKVIAIEPSVAEVAVVGLPDEEWGERLHAFVVPQPESTVDIDGLIARCRRSLSGYKVPRGITVIDELPRNASGKILKKALREL